MTKVIEVSNLTKIFGKTVKAIDHIDFEVEEGEVFGFLAPNGAGKTIALNKKAIIKDEAEKSLLHEIGRLKDMLEEKKSSSQSAEASKCPLHTSFFSRSNSLCACAC